MKISKPKELRTRFFRRFRPFRWPAFGGAVTLVLVTLVFGAGIFQAAPRSPTIPASSAITAAGCNSLTYQPPGGTMPPGPATVPLGCGSANPAFSVTQVGVDIPTFNATGITALAITPSANPTCGSSFPLTDITSGTSMSLAQGAYFYCVVYPAMSQTSTIAPFTVGWAT